MALFIVVPLYHKESIWLLLSNFLAQCIYYDCTGTVDGKYVYAPGPDTIWARYYRVVFIWAR